MDRGCECELMCVHVRLWVEVACAFSMNACIYVIQSVKSISLSVMLGRPLICNKEYATKIANS